jgi:hypothetical protein
MASRRAIFLCVSKPPYRAPIPLQPDPYRVAWAELRRRRRFYWLSYVLVAAPFVAPIVLRHFAPCGCLEGQISAAHLRHVVLGSFLVCAAGFLAAVHYQALVRCPRCGNRFGVKRWVAEYPREDCLHCGIAVGTPKSVVTAAEKSAGGP